MKKYVLTAEVRREASDVEWWMDQTDSEITAQVFDSFPEAKLAMRKTVKKLAAACDFFPFEGKRYAPVEEYLSDVCDEDIAELSDIISRTITDTGYEADDPQLSIEDIDSTDGYLAFVAKPECVVAEYYSWSLKFNIHHMAKAAAPYFFEYAETDDEGTVVNSITVRLQQTGKVRRNAAFPAFQACPEFETVEFGRYRQKTDSDELSPITWYVLEKNGDEAFLFSERILDYVRYGEENGNCWGTSGLRKWLNEDFYNTAFSEEEMKAIIGRDAGEKVSLISLDEYMEYYSIDENIGKAGYTDYCRAEAEDHYGTRIREPYGFWWTKSENKEGNRGGDENEYVWHVCNDGRPNPFERSEYEGGVRPVIRIRGLRH